MFFHHVRVGGGKPPTASHLREIEEFNLAVYLVLTLRPFSINMLGFSGGTTTVRSIK